MVSAETVQGIVFLQRQFGTAVDTCIASNYVKLPPPLISYRHCDPVNPFGVQSCKDEARGSQGSAPGGVDKNPTGRKAARHWVSVGRAVRDPPKPHTGPAGPSAGYGDAPGDTQCRGLEERSPGERRVGTKVARPRSKPWVCISWAVIPALKEVLLIEQPKLYGLWQIHSSNCFICHI